jgi:alpha-tubulin suppressor-like RCC1 family protein
LPVGCGDGAIDSRPDAYNDIPVCTPGHIVGCLVGWRFTILGGCFDIGGDPLTYTWTQSEGPPAELVDPNAKDLQFRPRMGGMYEFQQVASDGKVASNPASYPVWVWDADGGEGHSVALKYDGRLTAWGRNLEGQLGMGDGDDRSLPARVCAPGATDCETDPLTGVVAVAAGGADPLIGVIAIAAGDRHSLALLGDGTVRAWGSNVDGQLGDGTGAPDSPFPVAVCAGDATPPCAVAGGNLLAGVTLIAGGGGHTLAVDAGGVLWAWGRNESGQAGIGDARLARLTQPVRVCAPGEAAPCASFLSDVIDIDAGAGHSLAVDAGRDLWAWGSNAHGELGLVTSETCGTASCATTPRRVCASGDDPCTTPIRDVTSFAAGTEFTLAVLFPRPLVYAWGDNTHGQLGNGTTTGGVVPTQVCHDNASPPCAAFIEGRAVIVGASHSMRLDWGGGLAGFGSDEFGQLGDGVPGDVSLVPRVIEGL